MDVLTVTPLFPSAASPFQGVFVKERQRHLPDGVRATVLRCRPWFPGASFWKAHHAALPPIETVDGLVVHDLRFPYVPGVFKAADGDFLARALTRWIAGRPRFDLLDAHFLYPTGYAAVRAARRLGLPAVVTERGTAASYRDAGRRRKMRAALAGATRVVAVSESLARVCREIAGADVPVRVIPNGVDAGVFRPGDRETARAAAGVAGRGPVLLTVGGLVPRKGVARVLEVLPALRARYPDLVYLVVGGGGAEGDHEKSVRRSIVEGGLADAVRLLGAVEHGRLADYYRAADVFVLATANEGWANALQEALACGTPVVATDVGGNREVVGPPENGTLVPFGDAPALERALAAALGRRFDREAIARFGARRDWRAVGREVLEVYEEALRGG